MFNKHDVSDKQTKFSLTGRLGFRVPGEFRDEVDQLANESTWELTDIARVGLQAFWPDIRALVLASGSKPPKQAEEIRELRDFIELCRTAQKRGVDPRKALTDALEAKLSAEAVA